MVTGYGLSAYGAMIEDPIRMTAYCEALRRHVREGSIVVEIGAGPGVMSLLACRLGAARVHAIEPNASIEVARRFAIDNGFADRIVFHRALSTEVELAERADVLVSDLRGTLPLLENHIPSIRDARSRLLKPGGTQLPQRDRLMVGLTQDLAWYSAMERPWSKNAYGLDLTAARRHVVNSWHGSPRETGRSGLKAREWASIDYRTVETPNVDGTVSFDLEGGDAYTGLELWFEAEVCEGVRYCTGPDQPDQVYGRAWLPLEQPVHASSGDRLDVRISMSLVNGRYVTRWASVVRNSSDEVRIRFDQSTFKGAIISPAELRTFDPVRSPTPTARAMAARFVLERFDGRTSLAGIADLVLRAHPAAFTHEDRAIEFVRELAGKFCR